MDLRIVDVSRRVRVSSYLKIINIQQLIKIEHQGNFAMVVDNVPLGAGTGLPAAGRALAAICVVTPRDELTLMFK